MTAAVMPVNAVPPVDRHEAAVLAATENDRFLALVRSLNEDEWTNPTDCTEWDVRALATHVLGAMEGHVRYHVFVHQILAGNKAAGDRPAVDGMTEVQVAERLHLTPRQIVEQMTLLAPKAARGRARVPAPLRRITSKVEWEGVMERWTLAFLLDVILTRDTWMHRVDVSRATGRALELTPEHDGRIVADVVAEWARRHGRPFTLHLEGPAGGTFVGGDGGDGGETITMDAVEFCRTVSGREQGKGLLAQAVPF